MIPSWFVAGTVWLLIGFIVINLGLLAILEATTYYVKQPPITFYVRSFDSHHMILAGIIGLTVISVAAAGFTHFILDR